MNIGHKYLQCCVFMIQSIDKNSDIMKARLSALLKDCITYISKHVKSVISKQKIALLIIK